MVVWGVGARKSQEENLPNNVLVTVLNSVVTGRRFSSFVPSSTMRKLFTCIRAGVLALDTACSQGGFQGWQVQLNATLVPRITVQEVGGKLTWPAASQHRQSVPNVG